MTTLEADPFAPAPEEEVQLESTLPENYPNQQEWDRKEHGDYFYQFCGRVAFGD